MTDAQGKMQIAFDADALTTEFATAADEITRISEANITPAFASIGKAAESAGQTVRSHLASAAKSGELSFKALARAVAADLAGLAVETAIRRPLEQALSGAVSGLSFGGARAGGGAVAPGAAYLVGERGPELFAPRQSGRIAAPGGASVTVNFNLPPDMDAARFQRTQGQIGALVARAVGRGMRNM